MENETGDSYYIFIYNLFRFKAIFAECGPTAGWLAVQRWLVKPASCLFLFLSLSLSPKKKNTYK